MKIICHAKRYLTKEHNRIWLSKQTGIKYSHLGDIVNNRHNNTYLEYAYAIAQALGKDIEEVFEFIEE
ncbi:helix-turn-helix domain-containing protein [Halocella sp. SP3-1]|uniref:helix-turn-helix domain-containing protein n=1 Tax=Halocella sp. SP3-1 TaxID=2382161 RepID=UPI000F75C2BA|nr:helix-turn-helix domain-containing protein [Halocella sp. SP3-1]AZO96112.1 hypothetical protein D7D81_16780 [Halocella sp. SP3-1]